jgi:hypothetical protein
MTPLYRWDGRYVGFRIGDHLFTPDGEAFGWVDEDETAWHADGRYLGEMVDDNYVGRQLRAPLEAPPRPVSQDAAADAPRAAAQGGRDAEPAGPDAHGRD